MRGELWQECRKRGCETEPVCAVCEYCARHCECGPAPTEEERAAWAREKEAKAAASAAARAQLVTAAAQPDFDPLTVPLQYMTSMGIWRELESDRVGKVLDLVLEREVWLAKRLKRAPLTTRLEVAQKLVAGSQLKYGDDWYEEIKLR